MKFDLNTLLIDDDPWIRHSMSLFYESEGCQLAVLETAEEGLELLHRRRFDIFVCDFRLPGMNGIEFFKCIQITHADSLKILTTAYGSVHLTLQAVQSG